MNPLEGLFNHAVIVATIRKYLLFVDFLRLSNVNRWFCTVWAQRDAINGAIKWGWRGFSLKETKKIIQIWSNPNVHDAGQFFCLGCGQMRERSAHVNPVFKTPSWCVSCFEKPYERFKIRIARTGHIHQGNVQWTILMGAAKEVGLDQITWLESFYHHIEFDNVVSETLKEKGVYTHLHLISFRALHMDYIDQLIEQFLIFATQVAKKRIIL